MLEIKDFELFSLKNKILSINDLILKEGDFIYITGKNRTGKSLFLKSLIGEYKDFKGIITYKNQLLIPKDFRSKIRIISLENRLIPQTNVLDNIIFPEEKATEVQKIKIFELLSEAKSENLIHTNIDNLSFSETKLIELIKACFHYPLLLLLDDLDLYFDDTYFSLAKTLFSRLSASGTIVISTGKIPSQKLTSYVIHENELESL